MRVMIDACVLYPTVMREIVLGCAGEGLFAPRWSARLLEEWARAAARTGGEADALFARGQIARLRARWPESEIAVPAGAERRFWLPDPDDVHVLAAAVTGSCDAILTLNAKDFPGNLLAEEGLFRADPDGFLLRLADEAPDKVATVAEAVLAQARAMSDPDWTMRGLLKKARLPRLGKRLA